MRGNGILEQQTPLFPVHKRGNKFWGSACLFFGCVSFLGFFFAAFLSKLLPQFENRFLSAIQSDSSKGKRVLLQFFPRQSRTACSTCLPADVRASLMEAHH